MTPQWLSDLHGVSQNNLAERQAWLQAINTVLNPQGIKITEEYGEVQRPLPNHPEIEYPDLSLAVWERSGRWRWSWHRVATILAVDQYPSVKGLLPEGLQLKKVTLGNEVPEYHRADLVSLLYLDSIPIMAISGYRATVYSQYGKYNRYEMMYSIVREEDDCPY